MPRRVPQLAKLSRPRLHNAVPRERLFALLDDAREHKPAICVVGPPGAGKTTLVASWIDTRGIKGIWYQVDPGDADLATFFYYLGEAAKAFTRKGQRPLPLLTLEYLQDIDGFSRRFFRELFARLPEGAVLALDNYQELDSDQRLHEVVALAINEVCAGRAVVLLSRQSLPECFARLIVNGDVHAVEWGDLRLTREEAQAIAAARSRLERNDVYRLHEQSDGWAAGLTLLLESACLRGEDALDSERKKDLFDYFASQILERVPSETGKFLLETAFLPWVGADIAQALTGNQGAKDILDQLHRKHLFTHRVSGQSLVYRYHALFREFLLDRATTIFDSSSRARLMLRAANLLRDHGDQSAALQLYCDAMQWNDAADLLARWASPLLSQGRWHSFQEYAHRLPKECLDSNPWLRYWLGVSQSATDAATGRPALELAYAEFQRRGNAIGQMLCATEVLRSYFFEYHSFQRVDPWIDILGELVAGEADIVDETMELRIYSGLLLALISRRPGHALIDGCVHRTRALIASATDPNLVLTAGISLAFYAAMSGNTGLAEEVATLVRPQMKSPSLSPMLRTFWVASYGYLRYVAGDHVGALALFEEAEHWANEHRLISRIYYVLAWHAYCARRSGDLETAEALAARIQAIPAAIESKDKYVLWIRALNERSRGRLESAVRLGWDALNDGKAPECALHGSQHLHQTEMLIELGDIVRARACFEAAKQRICGGFSEPAWRPVLRFIDALIAIRECDPVRAEAETRVALLCVRDSENLVFLRWFRYTLSQVLPFALEAGTDVETAGRLARALDVTPAPPYLESWPWKARVYTLGRFEILVDDRPLNYSHKAPKKPLALLKALIAFGGHNVPIDKLVDALWDDEEGDSGREACWLALHRLRKLLGSPDTMQLIEGKVSLNPALVWVDAVAFERLLAAEEIATEHSDRVARALGLYRGDFLPEEPDVAWAVVLRERLRAKFVREVELYAQRIEQAARWDDAIGWYLRALDADPLAEAFYQGLMRSYRAQGRLAEAMSTYRRLRQILSVTLGMTPSSATESIARDLLAGV